MTEFAVSVLARTCAPDDAVVDECDAHAALELLHEIVTSAAFFGRAGWRAVDGVLLERARVLVALSMDGKPDCLECLGTRESRLLSRRSNVLTYTECAHCAEEENAIDTRRPDYV